MDRQSFVHKRKKRYMAQILDEFEADVEPFVSTEIADKFKGTIRRKLHALALDSCEMISLKPGEELNGEIVVLRDQMREPRPHTMRSQTA